MHRNGTDVSLPRASRTKKRNAPLTDFQQRVYRAVCRIPRGHTRSYQWVAEQIGHPGAARAVGQALHRNPFAPHVPCHRVVRADGSLGGYAGGLARKRALLRKEGSFVRTGQRYFPDQPKAKGR